MHSLRTYPKHECLRPCPKPLGAPFLANRRSLFIVPWTPDSYETLQAAKKITCTSEPRFLWKFLNFYSSVCYLFPMNQRVGLDWLHEVLFCDKPKHSRIPGKGEKQTDTGKWKTDLINPQCLRMQEKPLRNVEFFHWCPRQASTRLTGVWYSISLSRRKEQKGSCCSLRYSCIERFATAVSLLSLICCCCKYPN